MPLKPPIYILPHGIEVIGEYPPNKVFRYWRVRMRPHPLFPDAEVVHGGIYVHRSRAILTSKLGRALLKSEHAHHVDENKENDSFENVVLLSAAEHNRHHKTGSHHNEQSKAKTSASLRAAYASGRRKYAPMLGENNASTKLNERTVRYIRESMKSSCAIARELNVSKQTILAIRHWKTWRHVT